MCRSRTVGRATVESDRAIPEAVVEQVAAHWVKDWPPGFTTIVCDVLRSVPPLIGPGPNGEWGTWEQVGWHSSCCDTTRREPDDCGCGPLGREEPVYRFVPESNNV